MCLDFGIEDPLYTEVQELKRQLTTERSARQAVEEALEEVDKALIETNKNYQRHICPDGYCYRKPEHAGLKAALTRCATREALRKERG